MLTKKLQRTSLDVFFADCRLPDPAPTTALHATAAASTKKKPKILLKSSRRSLMELLLGLARLLKSLTVPCPSPDSEICRRLQTSQQAAPWNE